MADARFHRRAFAFLLVAFWAAWFGIGPQALAQNFPQEIVVTAYNVENYHLTGNERVRPKSEKSRDAVAEVVAQARPDILGICEIGSREAAEDLRARLQRRGVDLFLSEFVDGPDPDRHLALLSRFRVVESHSEASVPYEMDGMPSLVKRGFLDVTLQITPGYQLRLVGGHLKSKRPVPEGEAEVRRREAQLLRKRVEAILSADPKVNLLVYGDLNETREQPLIRDLLGPRGGGMSLSDVPVEDAQGERWTHYWRAADVYSRIDYLLVSRGLLPEVIRARSRIEGTPVWRDASDHRAISMALVPVNR